MDASLQSLLGRLEHLSDQFCELRDGIQQVVRIAGASPEMALTRARKVLEYVIRDVYQRRINEPPGTRPLENLLQRLVKNGFFPDRLDAYASTVRKLGNVGTHGFGERVEVTDVYQSLTQLMPILEWYFEVERPEALNKQAINAQTVNAQLPKTIQRTFTQSDAAAHSDKAVVPKGLRSFDAYDADFFLDLLPGPRDKEGLPDSIRFWKHRIEAGDEETFTVGIIYGPSGCGKSSLVKAGLLPKLDRRITPVYIESTTDETEGRLLKGLRKRRPDLGDDLPLAETIKALRRSQTGKVVLVLDQFEQWLHAHGDKQDTELAQALRQCDGQHVQCIVLVRDDFWMALSRFMGDVQIELLQGQNMAAVDLFDPIHARYVLAAFGRAFGRLERKLTKEQESFLGQAIQGLAQDGRVISVRLALFAEMVKGKPWVSATLLEVGGTEGIGVNFLEESFSAATASGDHRYHQKSARAVLKALLPESGTDIKGHMRSYAELLEESGHTDHPNKFDDLIRILDSELRLITPTHSEEKSTADLGLQPQTRQKYYQLTHDYLIDSLREWLTRKQKETWRGRAELRLADRAAMWNARPENQQLPSLFQWLNIRSLTKKENWTLPERKMMHKAGRYHGLHTAVAALLLLCLAVVGRELIGRGEARSLVDQLVSADIVQVPDIVKKMDPYRRWANPLLRAEEAQAKEGSAQQLHLKLALLPVDKSEVADLRERLLVVTANQFPVVRSALVPYQQELVEPLWQTALDFRGLTDQQFQAACALATFAPTDPRWNEVGWQVAVHLVSRPASEFLAWREALRPAKAQLLKSLGLIYRDKNRLDNPRLYAAETLADYVSDDRDQLFDLLADAEPFQFMLIFGKFANYKPELVALAQKELGKQPAAEASDVDKESLAQRQANAAVALYHLGEYETVWPLLKWNPDPRVRSYIIHWLHELGANPQPIAERLGSEPDLSIRRALVLSLGEFPLIVDDALATQLEEIYQAADDPGLHAAAEWLLGQAQQDEFLMIAEKRAAGKEQREKRLANISQNLKTASGKSRQWFVNSQGQTMVVIPGPLEFSMGSPASEMGRFDDEPQHRVMIRRTFAIASTPVTIEQYRRFNPGYEFTERFAPKACCPAISVSWYEAAGYCNWLTS